MTKKLLLSFATLALAVASAAGSYRVTLFQPAVLSGTELKPGAYKITVTDNKAVISSGKTSVEAAVRQETADSKFNSTTIRFADEHGKYRVQEIRLGGTTTKLIFEN